MSGMLDLLKQQYLWSLKQIQSAEENFEECKNREMLSKSEIRYIQKEFLDPIRKLDYGQKIKQELKKETLSEDLKSNVIFFTNIAIRFQAVIRFVIYA